MTIHILWPTIRPAMACSRAKEWLGRSSSDAFVLIRFGLGNVDGTRVLHEGLDEIISQHQNALFGISHYENANPGVAHTAALMSRGLLQSRSIPPDDLIVLASDDYDPPEGWDSHLIDQFKGFDGMLIVNDSDHYKKGTNIIPIPICSFACLKRLNGILYHPSYHHFFSDQELFDVCTEMKIEKDLRGSSSPKFQHKHWSFSGRDRDHFDMRNNEWWKSDKETYETRKDWSVDKKLELPEEWK